MLQILITRKQLANNFSLGTSKSIEECQHQFENRHWNCSTVRDGTVFGPVLSHGKEIFYSRNEFFFEYFYFII